MPFPVGYPLRIDQDEPTRLPSGRRECPRATCPSHPASPREFLRHGLLPDPLSMQGGRRTPGEGCLHPDDFPNRPDREERTMIAFDSGPLGKTVLQDFEIVHCSLVPMNGICLS